MNHSITFWLSTIILLFTQNAIAQCNIKVYDSKDSFERKTPAQEFTSDAYTLDRSFSLTKSDFSVKISGEGNSLKYKAGDLFAFEDESCNLYFFHDGTYYQLVEKGPVYVYKTAAPSVVLIGGVYHDIHYYRFSRNLGESLMKITEENLMKAYSDNPSFVNILKDIKQVKKYGKLEGYNDEAGTYNINLVYQDVKK